MAKTKKTKTPAKKVAKKTVAKKAKTAAAPRKSSKAHTKGKVKPPAIPKAEATKAHTKGKVKPVATPKAEATKAHTKGKVKPLATPKAEATKTPAKGKGKPAVTPRAETTKAAAAATTKGAKGRGLLRPKLRPEAFSLDEVREIAKANSSRRQEPALSPEVQAAKAREAQIEARFKKASTPHHVKPASLADILGYNPAKQAAPSSDDVSKVATKFQKFYRLLIQLREHVQTGLNTHAEETLKRSSKDDTGDLSGYGQHMADAGTDTFDRDFALSLVSSEQEALTEIESAIKRILNGTYGVCELTGKPISRERLTAVPFARFSVESQSEVERLKRRSSQRGGVFGETGDEAKVPSDDGED